MGEFIKLVKIRIKIQVYEVKKSEKQTSEVSNWVKKLQNCSFFQKTRSYARRGKTFCIYNKNMRKGELFKLG